MEAPTQAPCGAAPRLVTSPQGQQHPAVSSVRRLGAGVVHGTRWAPQPRFAGPMRHQHQPSTTPSPPRPRRLEAASPSSPCARVLAAYCRALQCDCAAVRDLVMAGGVAEVREASEEG